jgi:microcin C transport system ATP-binding protein
MLPVRHRMQVVFQDPNSSLNPRLNVQQIIEEGLLRASADANARSAGGEVIRVMNEVGLIRKPAAASRLSFPAVSASVLP